MKAWTIEGVFKDESYCDYEEQFDAWAIVDEAETQRRINKSEREYARWLAIKAIKPADRTPEQKKEYRKLSPCQWLGHRCETPVVTNQISWPFEDGKRYRVTVKEVENQFQVRCSSEQLEVWKAAAKRRGVPLTELVRTAIERLIEGPWVQRKPVPKEIPND